MNDAICLRDDFASRFLLKYHTRELLKSFDCLCTLGVLAVFLDLDAADIECRHAWIRRHLLAKSSTWQTEASRISSDFILMRWRQLGSAQWYSKAAGDAPENKDT